jgi:hypothetical protein
VTIVIPTSGLIECPIDGGCPVDGSKLSGMTSILSKLSLIVVSKLFRVLCFVFHVMCSVLCVVCVMCVVWAI